MLQNRTEDAIKTRARLLNFSTKTVNGEVQFFPRNTSRDEEKIDTSIFNSSEYSNTVLHQIYIINKFKFSYIVDTNDIFSVFKYKFNHLIESTTKKLTTMVNRPRLFHICKRILSDFIADINELFCDLFKFSQEYGSECLKTYTYFLSLQKEIKLVAYRKQKDIILTAEDITDDI